ncbi:MAG: hypothetical protein M1314_02720 [Firmicutes bacterium]|nr:hypothetical protein [Bacillota bacterium]
MIESMADLGFVGWLLVIMGLELVAMAVWVLKPFSEQPSVAHKRFRVAVGTTGVLLAVFGAMSLTLNILDAPNWRHEAVTYCLGHGGVRLALTGTFGGTDAVVCGDGTIEDYEGLTKSVRVRPFRW